LGIGPVLLPYVRATIQSKDLEARWLLQAYTCTDCPILALGLHKKRMTLPLLDLALPLLLQERQFLGLVFMKGSRPLTMIAFANAVTLPKRNSNEYLIILTRLS